MRAHATRAGVPLLAAVLCLGPPALTAARAEDAPANPFEALALDLRLGAPVSTPFLTAYPLRLDPARQVPLDAHVGLEGAPIDIRELPGPAGRWHLRVHNRGERPLLLDAGEALRTPAGPSRQLDRPVWIPADAGAFVPVVQATAEPPTGPYRTLGRGLTPRERALLEQEGWAAAVRRRNEGMGVPRHRRDDAAAAYVTDTFETALGLHGEPLQGLADGVRVVGVLLANHRGPYFAHVEADARRFAARWTSLREEIALDAATVDWKDRRPPEPAVGTWGPRARELLAVLRGRPMLRPTFGAGWEYRWTVAGGKGHWQGLAVPRGIVSLTLHVPAQVPARPGSPPPGPGGPGGPREPAPSTPGRGGLERRPRPTLFEERLRERREGGGVQGR